MGKNYTYVPGAEFPYQYRYEHMAVTTDCVIFTYEDRQLKVLLVCRGGEPYKGSWAFPGGFLQLNETAKDGALRELREETGMEAAAIGELGVFSDPDRDPRERVITIAYYALVKPSEVIGGDDADEAAWFTSRHRSYEGRSRSAARCSLGYLPLNARYGQGRLRLQLPARL